MGNRAPGMDSRVSAAGHGEPDRRGGSQDQGQRDGELVLDGALAGLHRPSRERGPVIPEVEAEAHRRREPATPQGGNGLVVVHSGRLANALSMGDQAQAWSSALLLAGATSS